MRKLSMAVLLTLAGLSVGASATEAEMAGPYLACSCSTGSGQYENVCFLNGAVPGTDTRVNFAEKLVRNPANCNGTRRGCSRVFPLQSARCDSWANE